VALSRMTTGHGYVEIRCRQVSLVVKSMTRVRRRTISGKLRCAQMVCVSEAREPSGI
jgi:hypothetical protein